MAPGCGFSEIRVLARIFTVTAEIPKARGVDGERSVQCLGDFHQRVEATGSAQNQIHRHIRMRELPPPLSRAPRYMDEVLADGYLADLYGKVLIQMPLQCSLRSGEGGCSEDGEKENGKEFYKFRKHSQIRQIRGSFIFNRDKIQIGTADALSFRKHHDIPVIRVKHHPIPDFVDQVRIHFHHLLPPHDCFDKILNALPQIAAFHDLS